MRYASSTTEKIYTIMRVRDAIKKSCKEHLEREMNESILNEKISRLPNAQTKSHDAV